MLCLQIRHFWVKRRFFLGRPVYLRVSFALLTSKIIDLLHKQWPPPHTTVACRALREMPSPGKSGSVFFLSDDDRFMIKTVSHEEMLLLLKLIPAYYRHCADNPTTLLTRFFGVHRVKPLGSQSKAWLPHACLL